MPTTSEPAASRPCRRDPIRGLPLPRRVHTGRRSGCTAGAGLDPRRLVRHGAASDYDGSAIAARHDVTVVAINYRLGLFGFVDVSCLGTDHVGSAANGIADQIAALGWIRDNISSFGGDPDNVTVAGQSAGAGSVLGLIAAPASHGLFRRAIVASPGSLLPEPPDLHVPLAAALGVTIEGLGDALLGASSDQLVAAQQTLGIINAGIDGTVITSDPIDALSDTAAPLDALMIGTTADEGTLFTAMLGADSPALAAATALGVRLLDPPVGAGRYLAGLRARHLTPTSGASPPRSSPTRSGAWPSAAPMPAQAAIE
ncbi:MAG: carboxylesterase family protein [Acidimicrobiales bacterium]